MNIYEVSHKQILSIHSGLNELEKIIILSFLNDGFDVFLICEGSLVVKDYCVINTGDSWLYTGTIDDYHNHINNIDYNDKSYLDN